MFLTSPPVCNKSVFIPFSSLWGELWWPWMLCIFWPSVKIDFADLARAQKIPFFEKMVEIWSIYASSGSIFFLWKRKQILGFRKEDEEMSMMTSVHVRVTSIEETLSPPILFPSLKHEAACFHSSTIRSLLFYLCSGTL